MKPLGDVCEFVRGITFKPTDLVEFDSPDSLACFRTKNVQASLETEDLIHIPRSFVKSDRQIIREGDTLISTANSNNLVGKCCYTSRLGYPATLGGFIAAIRAKPTQIQPRFLYYWLSSPFTQERFRGLARQTTNISNLPLTDVAKELAPVPPLLDQERIVKLLDEADELRKLRAKADRRTTEFIPAIFHEMFSIPANSWQNSTLGKLVHDFHYGTSNKSTGEGKPTLRIPNVVQQAVNLDDLKFVPVSDADFERLRLIDGDLLFVRTNGNADYVGRCAVFDTKTIQAAGYDTDEFIYASYLIRARLQMEKVSPIFVQNFLTSFEGLSALRARSKTSAGQFNINTEGLSSIPIPVPPLPLQKEFVQRVTEIRALETSQAASRRRLEALFQSLLHRAFNGEL